MLWLKEISAGNTLTSYTGNVRVNSINKKKKSKNFTAL